MNDMTTDFDLNELEAGDEATLAIKGRDGRTTTWLWTFYGPGHAKTVEIANRVSRKYLKEAREKEQAQVNGRKWKADDRAIDDIRAENVANIVERTKTFTPVRVNGETIEFSPEAATCLLLDPRKGALLSQISDFLREEDSFLQPSPAN